MSTLTDYFIQYGDVIGYAVVGAIALLALVAIQLIRRHRDLKRARLAARLVSYSICEPRQGPVAVRGTYHQSQSERWIDCKAQRVSLDSVEVVCGTQARWHRGVRAYALRDGDVVIAIGVMSRLESSAWRLASSPEEQGVQLYATTPRPTPAPLWPWRGPLILAFAGGCAYFSAYKVGQVLVDDATCADPLGLQVAAAMPLVRDDALATLRQCPP